jgi:autotransporter-associated beta strand protein
MSPIDHNTLLSEHRSGYRYSKEQSREKRGPGWMIPVTIIASLFTAGAVHAAPVTWGPVTNVSGPSDVLTNGTYVDSATCRAADLTVNGIPFNRYAGDGAAVTPSTILGSGNYDLHFANGSNIIMAFDKGPRANGAASFGPRNTDYDKLLSATDYSGANNRVLSLGGLTVGRSYQVQIWSAYYEGGPYGFSIAGNSFTMNTTAAQFVVGTFTADAVRQDLSITTNPSYTFLPGAVSLRDLTPPTPPASSAWTNSAGGSWPTTTNWQDGVPANGIDATADFGTLTLSGNTTVALDGARTIGSLVFGDVGNQFNWIVNVGTGGPLTLAAAGTPTITVNNQTATISAMLAGGSGLTKAGPGRLILTGTNNYPGDTTVNAGTLQLGDGSTANGAIAGNIINDATMIFANPSQYKYLSMVSGSGTLVKQGAGLLWFGRSTPWAYAGAVDVQLGTFRPTDNYHPATMTSVNVAAGATLDHYYASFSIDALTGAGNITDSGNNNQTLTLGASGGTSLFGGVMNNNLKLVKAGGGTATLTGANTYTGNTTVSDGTLELAATGHLKFVPTTNGASNKLTGTGTVNLKGIFDIDLSGAATATGNSWTLVDVGSLTANYDSTSFSVTGFTDPEDDGTWTKTVDANTTWTFTESTGILTYTVTTPAGFGSWISDLAFGLAPADQDPTDDPDNDGLNNLLEYALGGTPNVNDAATIAPTGGPDGLGNYVFHYKRLDLSKTDTQQTVEWSDNLEDWTPIPIPLATAAPVTVTENGTAPDDITVTIATGGALKIFARLKVVTTP